MGIKGSFFPNFIGRTRSTEPVELKDALETGDKKGVDLSIWIVAALKGGEGSAARALTSEPQYHPWDILCNIDFKYDKLVSVGYDPIMYFDGMSPNVKALTRAEREGKVKNALAELEQWYEEARLAEAGQRISPETGLNMPITEEERKKVMKLRKDAAYPDEGIVALLKEHFDERGIKYRCAPFEADWQLVADELAGIISGIVSEDSDYAGLRGKQLITQINYKDLLCQLIYPERWIARHSAEENESYGIDDVPLLAAFAGCDYIPHLNGFGSVTIKEHWREYSSLDTAEQQSQYLLDIEDTAELPESQGGGKCSGWARLFVQTVSLYRHCPVLKLVPTRAGQEVNDSDPSTYRVVMAPLYPYEGTNWAKEIGFDRHPLDMLGLGENVSLADVYFLRVWPKTGEAPRRREVPKYTARENAKISTDEPLPPFARLNTDVQPICIQPDENLALFLLCRGIFVADMSREEVEEAVRQVICLGKESRVLPPVVKIEDKKYTGFEMFKLRPGASSDMLSWSKTFFGEVRRLKKTDDNVVDYRVMFSTVTLHERAFDLLKGGFYDARMIEFAKVSSVADDDDVFLLFRVPCLASQKDKQYTVYLCFKDEDNGCLMASPYSSCSCPVGSFFCAHMLGFLLILSIIQHDVHLTMADFLKYMQERVESLQELPMLVETIAVPDQVYRSKKRKHKD